MNEDWSFILVAITAMVCMAALAVIYYGTLILIAAAAIKWVIG